MQKVGQMAGQEVGSEARAQPMTQPAGSVMFLRRSRFLFFYYNFFYII
jgi:hypothetical protein